MQKNTKNTLENNVLKDTVIKTLAYYQAMGNLALTVVEIKKYIFLPDKKRLPSISIMDIQNVLFELKKDSRVKGELGFWSLKNAYTIQNRIKNSKTTEIKWKKIKKHTWFLPYIPYTKTVYVTGSIALNYAQKSSDIDLLTVNKKDRTWISRLFITMTSILFWQRKTKIEKSDKLCFNQHISEEEKKMGPGNIDFVVNSIKIPLWQNKKSTKNENIFSLNPKKTLLHLKNIMEKLLEVTYAGYVLEKISAHTQIKKIQNNPANYPAELEPLVVSSSNLIFFYPKVTSTEKKYTHIINL